MKLHNTIALLSIGLISTTSICMYSDERQQNIQKEISRRMEQQRRDLNEGSLVESYIKRNQTVPHNIVFHSRGAAQMAWEHNRRITEKNNQLK